MIQNLLVPCMPTILLRYRRDQKRLTCPWQIENYASEWTEWRRLWHSSPRSNLPHRYSIFGAAEIVKVSKNGTIPIRLVNPSAQPVKVFRETRLGDFSSVGDEVETFELNEFPQEVLSAMSEGQMKNELPHHDYSDFPDLSDSILNNDDRIRFRELFRCYRDVFYW